MKTDLFRGVVKRSLFLLFNGTVLVMVLGFIIGPLMAHYSSAIDELAESAEQLAQLQQLLDQRRGAGSHFSRGKVDPYLLGGEKRLVSADLQANLKAIASGAGTRVLRVRGLPDSRSNDIDMVSVSLELEGSIGAVKEVASAIESQVPFLFIGAASLRNAGEADQPLIWAELKVQGAVRTKAGPADYEVSQRSNALGRRDAE